MGNLKFAVLGTGWFANFQIPAWFEVGGVELVALYNRTVSKAEKLASIYNVPHAYKDAEELFKNETLDFVDIIAGNNVHEELVTLAARYRVPVICQKPIAPEWESCLNMVRACQDAQIPLIIHENLRWQPPIREVKKILDSGQIGQPYRARLQIVGYSPFEFIEQPFLKNLERLILMDIGSHLLDTARYLFGEPLSLYCQTARTREDIKGEDVASVMMTMPGITCTCEMSNASRTSWGHYPDVLVFIEGTQGSIELSSDFWLRIIKDDGIHSLRIEPPYYPWQRGDRLLWHASIVSCNQDILNSLKTGKPAETSVDDNLKTMRLVFAAYESALGNHVIKL